LTRFSIEATLSQRPRQILMERLAEDVADTRIDLLGMPPVVGKTAITPSEPHQRGALALSGVCTALPSAWSSCRAGP
jgi:hypothetical protein